MPAPAWRGPPPGPCTPKSTPPPPTAARPSAAAPCHHEQRVQGTGVLCDMLRRMIPRCMPPRHLPRRKGIEGCGLLTGQCNAKWESRSKILVNRHLALQWDRVSPLWPHLASHTQQWTPRLPENTHRMCSKPKSSRSPRSRTCTSALRSVRSADQAVGKVERSADLNTGKTSTFKP